MKVGKVLLLVLGLAMFSMAARADGFNDPVIRLGPSGASTHTMDGATASDPIFVTDGSHTDWFLDNDLIATNGVVFFEVLPAAGESLSYFLNEGFSCQPVAPVADGCSFLAGLQGLLSNAIAQGFGDIALSCSGYGVEGQITVACPAVEVAFTGPFTVGEDVHLDVPEPSALLLLLFGLPLALGLLSRKKLAGLAV